MKYRVAAVLKNFKHPIWGIRLQPVNPDRIFYFMAHKDFKDLNGKVFTRLTVAGYYGQDKRKKSVWWCICQCGKDVILNSGNLLSGHTRSCGCLMRERAHQIKHNGTHTKLYKVFTGMISRCECKTASEYHNYGGRGIKICSEWRNNFSNFRDWCYQNEYDENLSIDRINNEGNYEPGNCRFATQIVQSYNKRTTRRVLIKGVLLTVLEISEKYNLSKQLVLGRITKGFSTEEIIAPKSSKKWRNKLRPDLVNG